MRAPEEVEIGLRPYAVPDYARSARKGGREYVDLGPSEWELVLDSESSTDPGQRLRVGACQVHRPGPRPKRHLFFDPEALTADERATVESYAEHRGIRALTREVFVEKVFLKVAFWERGVVIGHNLPFDQFRLAIEHEPTKSRSRSMRGGFTLGLSEDVLPTRRDLLPRKAQADRAAGQSLPSARRHPRHSRRAPDARRGHAPHRAGRRRLCDLRYRQRPSRGDQGGRPSPLPRRTASHRRRRRGGQGSELGGGARDRRPIHGAQPL